MTAVHRTTPSRSTPRIRGIAFCGLGALLFAGSALAETPQQAYQRERAVCLSGQSSQDRATCLKEASAALVEARRGGLTPASGADAERCNALAGVERAACVARMNGAGKVSGSVEGGGVLRELTVREVMPPGSTPQQNVSPAPRR
ncbi:MAG: hypothetical protein ABIO45_14085 [Burkholderiaceae bacterium]